MENDTIVPVGKSSLHHGYLNNRIYLMKYHPSDTEQIIKHIIGLRTTYGYTKIILKIPKSCVKYFSCFHTTQEACIPDFYPDHDDALFISHFYDPGRCEDGASNTIDNILLMCKEKKQNKPCLSEKIIVRPAKPSDIYQMATLYRNVFATYPFPIHDPEYLMKSMNSGISFVIGEVGGEIVALGSSEVDSYARAVEMSDLVVDPRTQGLGLSKYILHYMENQMREKEVKTSYTICRAESTQVNLLFAGAGYEYGGTLIQNTNICGKIESMNIWYKPL